MLDATIHVESYATNPPRPIGFVVMSAESKKPVAVLTVEQVREALREFERLAPNTDPAQST